MDPVPFEDANVNLTGGHPDIADLPAYHADGVFVTCWRPTWRERLAMLFAGTVWVALLGHVHPPIALCGLPSANFEIPCGPAPLYPRQRGGDDEEDILKA